MMAASTVVFYTPSSVRSLQPFHKHGVFDLQTAGQFSRWHGAIIQPGSFSHPAADVLAGIMEVPMIGTELNSLICAAGPVSQNGTTYAMYSYTRRCDSHQASTHAS